MRRFLRSGVLIFLDQAMVSGTSFLTTIIVARVAGVHELATYALAMTLLLLLGAVHEALVLQPYTFHVHRMDGTTRPTYVGSVFASLIGLAVLAALALSGAGMLLPDDVGEGGLTSMLFGLAGVAPCWLLREFARRTSFAGVAVGTGVRIDASVMLLQLGSLAWLAATGRLSGLTALYATATACAVTGVGWLATSRGRLQMRPSHFGRDWRRNWELGRWILASRVAAQLNSEMAMPWLLLSLEGSAAAGLFAACLTVVYIASPMVQAAGLFLTPRIARTAAVNGLTAATTLVWKATASLGAGLGLYTLALVLLADPILRLMYGSQLAGHGASVAALAVALTMSVVGSAARSGLLLIERARVSLLSSAFGFCVLMITAPVLIIRWSVLGAAVALVAGSTAESITLMLYFRRHTQEAIDVGSMRRFTTERQEGLS